MTILLDGQRLCPPAGCNVLASTALSGEPAGSPTAKAKAADAVVDINHYIDANDIAGIEIYARGGNMPISLQTSENGCGVIAFWSGSRR